MSGDSELLQLYLKEVELKKNILQLYDQKNKDLEDLKNELETREQIKAEVRSMLKDMSELKEGLEDAFQHLSGKCQKILTFFDER